ncbi:HPr kinase/phosphorylase [candidate division KSB1 bacterium]|nr:HPr kinase/phosphorylase [candidate division KSB1 bacterium]
MMDWLTVKAFFEDNKNRLELEIVNKNAQLTQIIREKEIHRPGLALSGFVGVFSHTRIQILGNSEISFLNTLSPEIRKNSVRRFLEFEIPCIIITNKNTPPTELLEIANMKQLPVFVTPLTTTKLTQLLSEYLEEKFSPKITMHGSLVAVYGVGMLFTGRSGIGKSELALDLVERGHQLVADDVVNIVQYGSNVLIGSGSEMLQYHMEVRGLGIIDIRNIFGIRAIRKQKEIQVKVALEEWDEEEDYERIGIDEETTKILDVLIPTIKLPIIPGKNITVIAEVIALNTLMKQHGQYTAVEFNKRLLRKLQPRAGQSEYLAPDYE